MFPHNYKGESECESTTDPTTISSEPQEHPAVARPPQVHSANLPEPRSSTSVAPTSYDITEDECEIRSRSESESEMHWL